MGAQSAVDWVNPVIWEPWGPLAVARGWPQASHVDGGHRSDSGDPKHGGATTGFVGKGLQGTGKSAARPVRTATRRRVVWWWWHGRAWPDSAPAMSESGGAYGSSRKTGLRRASEQMEVLGRIYGAR